MTRQRQINVLSKQMRYKGTIYTRKSFIECKIKEGYTVTNNYINDNKFFEKDGTGYIDEDITKMGMDYAEFLCNK